MKLFDLFATIRLDSSEFNRGLNDATAAGKSFGSTISTGIIAKGAALGTLLTGLASKAGALAVRLVKTGVSYNSQIESYTTNFKVMLGSIEAAEAKVAELADFAAKTPFELSGLADATQTLLAFQVPASKTQRILQMLGDVSLGDKNKLSGLALVFGQVSSAGKLTGQDLMQMINQGFNPLNYIVKRTGESMAEARDRMSAGRISIEEVTQAFEDATGEGGQFYKGMEEASKTAAGQWSTLKDNVTSMLGTLMSGFSSLATSTIIPALIEQVDKISAAINRLLGTGETVTPSALFGDGEGQTEAAAAWLNDLLGVWSDGAKEDDGIVSDFTARFAANSEAIRAALEDRRKALADEGGDTSEIDANLRKLDEYDQQIADLLKKRQNGYFSDEDNALLEQITADKAALEESLGGGEALDTSSTEGKLSGLTAVINGVGDAIVWCLDNWDKLKIAAKTALALTIGVKITGVIAKIAGVLTGTAAAGPAGVALGIIASAAIWVWMNWPTDEEIDEYEKKTGEKIDKWTYFLTTKLGLPTDQQIKAWIAELTGKIESLWPSWLDWLLPPKSPAQEILDKYTSKTQGSESRSEDLSESADTSADSLDGVSDAADALTTDMATTGTVVADTDSKYAAAGNAALSLAAKFNLVNPRLFGGPGVNTPEDRAFGAVFTRPTLINSSAGIQRVGEAGAEAILPLDTLWREMSDRINAAPVIDYERLGRVIADRQQAIAIDGHRLAMTMAEANQLAIDSRGLIKTRGMGG